MAILRAVWSSPISPSTTSRFSPDEVAADAPIERELATTLYPRSRNALTILLRSPVKLRLRSPFLQLLTRLASVLEVGIQNDATACGSSLQTHERFLNVAHRKVFPIPR